MKLKKSPLLIYLQTIFLILFLVSCIAPKNINKDFLYFQHGLDSMGNVQSKETVIKTNDLLSIKIGSRSLNQEQTKLFNLGAGDSSNLSYTVNTAGNIDLPMIGTIKATGLTLAQLQTVITDKVVNYVKDPVVKVKYFHFSVNVLGEVKSPGTKVFPVDNVTIFDAIGASGDLTDFARREDIMVIREDNGRRKYFKVDFKSGSVFQSPVYQLQPNDLVYVPANNNKLVTLNKNPDAGKGLSTALQITSLGITVISLIYFLRR